MEDRNGLQSFLLAVITAPAFFPGEAACLEGLLAAGLEKLHLRKPGAGEGEMEALLRQIAPRWHSRLVLHPWAGQGGNRVGTVQDGPAGQGGGLEFYRLAARYGIPQVHCPLRKLGASREDAWIKDAGEIPDAHRQGQPVAAQPGVRESLALSSSLHAWDEMKEIEGAGLSYVFMSPVFDSISKPGYTASPGLLPRPAGTYPGRTKVIGLGGVGKDTIGALIREEWDGAAVLGYIWEDPGAATERYEELKTIITNHRA